MKSAWFHGWNPSDFIMKSAGFHMQMRQFAYEIRQISWNPLNFMKFAGFHYEIRRISWNLPDFTMKSAGFHEICQISPWNLPDFMNSGFCCIQIYMKGLDLPLNAVFFIRTKVLGMKSAGFHEIHRISWNQSWNPSWNPPDFMKSAEFHEIRRISCISQMSQGPMVLFLYFMMRIYGVKS